MPLHEVISRGTPEIQICERKRVQGREVTFVVRALVTGGTGFVGNYLVQHLLESGVEVWIGVKDQNKIPGTMNVVRLIECDVLNQTKLDQALDQSRPDLIFHLAAISSVAQSWKDPVLTFEVNVLGTLRLYEAILVSGLTPTVLSVGSAEEYGVINQKELPAKEENPLRPMSPYATSKMAIDLLSQQYFKRKALKVTHVRPVNHIGPNQNLGFVASDFSYQIARIEAGLQEPVIRVGNLEAQRDFLDVRDVVRAYRLVCERGEPGEVYNIGSGQPVSIEQILKKLLSQAAVLISIEVDKARLRPADIPVLSVDSAKLQRKTGWKPEFALERTLGEILNYWRSQVEKGSMESNSK